MFSSEVHHIAIICSNYEVSKKFYNQTLGFEILHEVFREDRRSWKLDLKSTIPPNWNCFPFPARRRGHRGPKPAGFAILSFRRGC